MLENTAPEKLTRKNATYPLPEGAPMSLVLAVCLPAMFMLLAVAYINYTKNTVQALLFEDLGAMKVYGIYVALLGLLGVVTGPIIGKLGDLYGRKRMILILAVLLLGFCFSCYFAKGAGGLLLAYILLGLSYQQMTAMMHGLIIDVVQGPIRTKFVSYNQTMSTIAGTLAPVIAGRVADVFGSANALLVAGLILVAAWIVLMLLYPDIRNIKQNVKIDFGGSILLLIGIGALSAYLVLGGKYFARISALGIGLLVTSVIGLVLFYQYEKKQSQPIVSMGLLSSKAIIPIFMMQLCYGSIGAMLAYFNVYAYKGMLYNATQVGSLSLLVWVAVVLTPLIGTYLAKTKKFRLIFIVGSIAGLLMAILYMFVLTPETPVWLTAIIKVPQYVATCCTLAPTAAYLGQILPADKRGMGLGLSTFAMSLGTNICTALYGGFFTAADSNIMVAWPKMLIVIAIFLVIRIIVAFMVKDVDAGKEELAKLS